MKIVKYFLLAILSGCGSMMQQDNIEVDYDVKDVNIISDIENVLKIVDNYIKFIESPIESRTNERTIASIEYYGVAQSRNGNSEQPLLYLVNYNDNNGFALIDANPNLNIIYAISPRGHMEFADSVNSEFLNNFFRITSNISAILSGFGPIYPVDYANYIYSVKEKVGPLLDENVANWHQDYPYNKYNPLKNGSYTKVGCGPLALTMLLTYYKKPASHNGYKFKWQDVLAGNEDLIAETLFYVGSNLLNATYGKDNTGINDYDIISCLQNLGYCKPFYNLDNFNGSSFSLNELKLFMKSGVGNLEYQCPKAPLIFCGTENEYGTMYSGYGHIWIVDGYIDTIKTPTDTKGRPIGSSITLPTMLHCVWGWEKQYNGYYAYVDGLINDILKKGITDNDTNIILPYMFTDYRVIGGICYN